VDQTSAPIDGVTDPDTLRALSGEIAATCAGFNLRRASRAVSQHFDHALAPAGLRMTQFTLLNALALGGSATINEISHALVIDRTTLTRNLRLLREAGLVAAQSGQTGREQRLSLTDEGQTILARAIPLWRAAQDSLVDHFDQARWPGLVADLDRLVEGAIGKHQHPGGRLEKLPAPGG
jgi:DNA-binding MarR family transcriptional regulator